EAQRLERTLRERRDRIPEMARHYYDLLAGKVDVHASDRDDEATITREPGGRSTVTLSTGGKEYFRRHFDGSTNEIRVYLHGGNDRLVTNGAGGAPFARVIGGGGDDQFTLHSGGIRLYDDKGQNRAEGGGINTKEWKWKPDSADATQLPPR